MAKPVDSSAARPRRWWLLAPVVAVAVVFGVGVRYAARHPDSGLVRLLGWSRPEQPGAPGDGPEPSGPGPEGLDGPASPDPGPGPRPEDRPPGEPSTPPGEPTPADPGPSEPGPGPDLVLTDAPWVAERFEIDLVPPPELRLLRYDPNAGLRFAIGPELADRSEPSSTLVIESECDGWCDYSLFAPRMAEDIPGSDRDRFLKLARFEWVREATERPKGTWSWHLRGFDERGAIVRERAVVIRLDPRADSYLACTVDLVGAETSEAGALLGLCERLSWRLREGPEPLVDTHFGHRYRIGARTFTIPAPPPSYAFSRYQPGVEVGFRVPGPDRSSFIDVGIHPACRRGCAPADLRERLVAYQTKRDQDDRGNSNRYQVEQAFEEFEPGRWRWRIRRSSSTISDRVEGEVVAVRDGALLRCGYELRADQFDQGANIEAWCARLLAE